MKIVVITQQTAFVRHWFRWYTVQRAGEDWRPLEIGKKYEKPVKFDVSKIAASLQKKYPSSAQLPAILDEVVADREVIKNTPKKKG